MRPQLRGRIFCPRKRSVYDSMRHTGQDPSGDSTRPRFTNRARGDTRGKCLGERRTRRTWPKLEKWQYDILRQIFILDVVRYYMLLWTTP